MKRHPGLVPLSREHHDGLLLATRLQQGPRALERLWSHDPGFQAQYVVRFFDDHLERHFQTEEEHIFPAGALLPGLKEVVDELLMEHDQLRTFVKTLREPPPGGRTELESLLVRLGEILEHHIRTEERIFFPGCEKLMTPAELGRVGAAVAARHKAPA